MNRRKGCGRRWYSHFGSVVKYIDDCKGTFHTVCSSIMCLRLKCFFIWYLGPLFTQPKKVTSGDRVWFVLLSNKNVSGFRNESGYLRREIKTQRREDGC